jgi:hypothetical protein
MVCIQLVKQSFRTVVPVLRQLQALLAEDPDLAILQQPGSCSLAFPQLLLFFQFILTKTGLTGYRFL